MIPQLYSFITFPIIWLLNHSTRIKMYAQLQYIFYYHNWINLRQNWNIIPSNQTFQVVSKKSTCIGIHLNKYIYVINLMYGHQNNNSDVAFIWISSYHIIIYELQYGAHIISTILLLSWNKSSIPYTICVIEMSKWRQVKTTTYQNDSQLKRWRHNRPEQWQAQMLFDKQQLIVVLDCHHFW